MVSIAKIKRIMQDEIESLQQGVDQFQDVKLLLDEDGVKYQDKIKVIKQLMRTIEGAEDDTEST